ncbi:DUF6879 family protein [Streptosporangium sp. NPDC001681]|uniref:DUF6879 family protein n=1 Tax=Streptosporangium sp. NPDC001681 TaxID=3154395 RepID=UPI003329D7F0
MEPTFDDLLVSARRSAVHLEMRDGYMRSDPAFIAWKRGEEIVPATRWPAWFAPVGTARARGVQIQRARIVSEPITDYVRFEYDITEGLNLAAGEDVRWLPRCRASDLALPGNDFWVFDDTTVMWNHFTGDGESAGKETSDDPAAVKLCTSAFLAVWERALPHAEYRAV